MEEIRHRQERGDGDDRLGDERHLGTALARGHPSGDETPRAIGELAAQPFVAGDGPLAPGDAERLAEEGMPGVVDDDGAWKLRSM